MSFRLRLLASLGAVLLVSLVLAAALACAQAVRSVRAELQAALTGAARATEDLALALGPAAAEPARLAGIVAMFDGNRHVQALLLDADGRVQAASRLLAQTDPPPGWFVWLVQPDLPPRRVPAGRFALLLRADPRNEAGETWDGFGDDALGLGAFCVLAAALTVLSLNRSLRPLAQLSAAFPRLAAGEWETRVAESGPPEIRRLVHGFNEMAARLAAAEAETRRLQGQLQTLQEEERAGVARDLHDEVGPLLFAASLAAADIAAAAGRHADAALADDAAALGELVGRVRQEVRGLLRRLRASPVADLGLAEAVEGLAAFWRGRYPAARIDVAVVLGAEPEPAVAEALYRCVQEGLANAFRHGRPGQVQVELRDGPGGVLARIRDDGAGAGAEPGEGMGLLGMRERVAALGGRLSAGATAGRGWELVAELPAARAA